MNGIISDILSFSLNDGPGVRTTVFLKGCVLDCPWCHNPENRHASPQVLYARHLCVHCGACAAVCPMNAREQDGSWVTDSRACRGCGKCAEVCPVGANTLYGREMTVEEVCARVLRDKPFFRENGGVTFSGGEPLFQWVFVAEAAERLHAEDISVALETTLFAPWERIEAILPHVSLWLCDWKMTDPAAHRRLTGVSNERILANLSALNEAGARIRLRCPVIPGSNDTEAHFRGIGALTAQFDRIEQVDLLPYHDIGNDKRRKMGLEPDGFTVPDRETCRQWQQKLAFLCRVPVVMK